MKSANFFALVLTAFAAFFSFSASAQTQNVPVTCNWEQVGVQSGPFTAIITFQCKENGGAVAATRQLTYSAPSWQVTNCSISLAPGVFNSGNCQNTNLYRVEPVTTPPSTCTTPGVQVHGACANQLPNLLNRSDILARCGSGCSLGYETVGWTSMCPNSGQGRSPEVAIICE